MRNRYKSLAVLCAAALMATASGAARALDDPPQIIIQSVLLEVGGGVSFARGGIGIDFLDPGLNDEERSFSTTRGFLGLGIATRGPRIGDVDLVLGANGQLFFDNEVFDLDFTNLPQLPGQQIRAIGENAFNFTPFIGVDFPLDLNGAPSRSHLRLFAGATVSDQKLIVEVDNGFDRQLHSASDLIVSPTIGAEFVRTNVLVPDQGTVVLGGLRVDTKARVQATFPRGLPGFDDVPALGSLFRQNRDAEISAGLMIVVTPNIVQGEE